MHRSTEGFVQIHFPILPLRDGRLTGHVLTNVLRCTTFGGPSVDGPAILVQAQDVPEDREDLLHEAGFLAHDLPVVEPVE